MQINQNNDKKIPSRLKNNKQNKTYLNPALATLNIKHPTTKIKKNPRNKDKIK